MNSWVIGLATGVVSGLLVFFVTSFLFDNKKKRDYELHVKEANIDIVNALKPYIAEQGLPGYQVLVSLITSTSRKYAVDTKDLLTPVQVCEELIREIIGDVYVTSEKKKEYTEKVAEFKESIAKKSGAINRSQDNNKENNNSSARLQLSIIMITMGVSLILVFSILMLVLLVIDPELARHVWLFPFENNIGASIVVSSATAVFTILIAALKTTALYRRKTQKESDNSDEGKDNTKSSKNPEG